MLSASSLSCTPSPLQALAELPMALVSASSSPAPSAASAAAAPLAVAAHAARSAAPAAGGRLSRAGLPPRSDDRAPGLLDGGLGCLPSPASVDAASASAAPSTPTAAVAPTASTSDTTGRRPSAGASTGLLLLPPSSGPIQTDLETEALLRPSYGQLRAPAQMDGGLAPQMLLLPSTPVVSALVTGEGEECRELPML
ncbi:hypothetical protein VPH35_005802 [Triticum aestivum]